MRRELSKELCSQECHAQCCRAPGFMTLQADEVSRLCALPGGDKLQVRINMWLVNGERVGGPFVVVWEDHERGRCPFLTDDYLCSIYEQRPEGCRTFPTRPMHRCLAWPIEEATP